MLLRECVVAQSCLTLCDPMDCSRLGSSVHGIFQVRILKQVVISYFRGSSQTQGLNQCLLYFPHWQVDSSPLRHLGSLIVYWSRVQIFSVISTLRSWDLWATKSNTVAAVNMFASILCLARSISIEKNSIVVRVKSNTNLMLMQAASITGGIS